jgi:hypothetical protein
VFPWNKTFSASLGVFFSQSLYIAFLHSFFFLSGYRYFLPLFQMNFSARYFKITPFQIRQIRFKMKARILTLQFYFYTSAFLHFSFLFPSYPLSFVLSFFSSFFLSFFSSFFLSFFPSLPPFSLLYSSGLTSVDMSVSIYFLSS